MIYLTQEYVKECLHYNQTTGVLTWKKRPLRHFANARIARSWNTRHQGKVVNTKTRQGYITIRLQGRVYPAHRLIFLYMEGRWPVALIDHIDQQKDNNSWANLREVSPLENMRNMKLAKNNTSGVTGVHYSKFHKKWIASISIRGVFTRFRGFATKEEAVELREFVAQEAGFHVNHGGVR